MTVRASHPIRLGPFLLDKPIGAGGMGSVWAARHETGKVDVAVKVITSDRAREPRYLDAFHNEVRAVAGLHHPGIVFVLDYGEVDRAAEEASGGALVAGSPYYVMELANGGSLREAGRQLGWLELRRVLVALLDALAHAHARGVVHKDLKPANVLLFQDGAVGARLKLTDFGIAQASQEHDSWGAEDTIMGSPLYMAPEQFRAQWRDYGPWTDLYALGGLAHYLATGTPPFAGRSMAELAQQHLATPPPAMRARTAIPDGFEAWVHRLLEKRPSERFRRAADAAWALVQLSDPIPDADAMRRPPETGAHQTVTLGATADGAQTAVGFAGTSSLDVVAPTITSWPARLPDFRLAASTRSGSDIDGTRAHDDVLQGTILVSPRVSDRFADAGMPTNVAASPRAELPPLPPLWHRVTPAPPSFRLLGAGLGLYGLRAPALVGRLNERDAIWAALTDVRSSARARLVLLHGNAGVGKSRLAEWVSRRAHEVGGAIVVKATHGPILGPSEGLGRAVASLLGCVGLDSAATRRRVDTVLLRMGIPESFAAAAVTEVIHPGSASGESGEGRRGFFSRPEERWGALLAVLERVCEERAIILWLDDIQWGDDALGFAAFLLKNQRSRPMPVLCVLTCRDEALVERPSTEEHLAAVLEHDRASRIPVPPLAPAEHARLVQGLLGLERTLALQVESRTAGNPLFAVQLVGDWVARGVLEVGEDGFRLRDGATVVLPDDLYGVWSVRLGRLLGDRGPQALEIAAALGQEVDLSEWREVCRIAGVDLDDELTGLLLRDRLAVRTETGWAFTHGMLRESLERDALEAGRWQQHHRCCVEMLHRRYGQGVNEFVERLGRHLLAAEQYEDALGPLITGARAAISSDNYKLALMLVGQHELAIRELGLLPDHRAHGENLAVRCNVLSRLGRSNEAFETASGCADAAAKHGWDDVLARAYEELASVLRTRSEFDEARSFLMKARNLYEAAGDVSGIGRAYRGLSWVSILSGDNGLAVDELETARRTLAQAGDLIGVASCLRGLGDVARNRNQMDDAAQYFIAGRDLYEELGNRWGVFNCIHGLAETQRFQGELEVAEAGYRSVIEFNRSLGSEDSTITILNLALVQIAREQYDPARVTLMGVVARFRQQEALGYLGVAHTCLMPCMAGLHDADGFDHHAGVAARLLREANLIDPDIAGSAELAGDLWVANGDTARARSSYDLALWQWTALENESNAQRVQAAAGASLQQ